MVIGIIGTAAVAAGVIVMITVVRLLGVKAADGAAATYPLGDSDEAWEIMRLRVLSLEIATAKTRRDNEVLQAELRRAQTRVAALETAARSSGSRLRVA